MLKGLSLEIESRPPSSCATDFDDILEELDSEFQKSLKVAAKEYRGGKVVSLREHLKARRVSGPAG